MEKTKVGLTFDLHKKLDSKEFELATNKKCLENWNCAGCLTNGITKQAEWHDPDKCKTCTNTDKLYLCMAFCEEHLQSNVTVNVKVLI